MDLEEKVRLLEGKIKTLEKKNNDIISLLPLLAIDIITRILLIHYMFK